MRPKRKGLPRMAAAKEDPSHRSRLKSLEAGTRGGASPPPTPMTTLKEQILEFVRGRSHVTLPQICRKFEAARGELSFRSRNFENVVFWEGMSQEAIDSLEELLEEKAIFMRPCSVQEHQGPPPDGFALLLLPLAMSGRSYASAHWRVVKLSRSP